MGGRLDLLWLTLTRFGNNLTQLFSCRFTYSVSFAALIAATAAHFDFWMPGKPLFDGFVVYSIIPIILIVLNTLSVKVRPKPPPPP